jgi:hypothetical protein
MGTQYHLTRFAFLYESTLVSDGTTLNPMGAPDDGPLCRVSVERSLMMSLGPGLKTIFETIDNRTDFKSYMQNYAVARGTPRGPRREGPYEDGFVSFPKLQSDLIVKLMSAVTQASSAYRESNRHVGTSFSSLNGVFAKQWQLNWSSIICAAYPSTFFRRICITVSIASSIAD